MLIKTGAVSHKDNPDLLMTIYLHELKKVDEFRRILRRKLGKMQEMEALYFNRVTNAGVKNSPAVRDCIANMHLCGKRWMYIRRRFHFVVKYRHLIVKHGSIENKFKIDPEITFVKNSE
jgi:hypothetical protein